MYVDLGHTFKTVFLGDSSVGKTCLAKLFVDNYVLESPVSTIGFDPHEKEVLTEEDVAVKVYIKSGWGPLALTC